jgi:hypothetical protein
VQRVERDESRGVALMLWALEPVEHVVHVERDV